MSRTSKTNKIDKYNTGLPGLNIRRNPKNGFMVAELDYFCDPLKRDPAWIKAERARVSPKQWAVEYERSWESWAGRPVYDKVFFPHLHVLKARREADPDYPLFLGYDFGGNQSIAICQIVGPRLYVVDELPNYGLNTETVMPKVIAFIGSQYESKFHEIDIVDPSSMWDSTRGRVEGAPAAVMREFGRTPIPAKTNDPKKRIGAVIKLLQTLGEDGLPNLVLNPNCTMLIKGFTGGYQYPDRVTQSRKLDQPVKNLFSHIHDALQYVALRVGQHDDGERSEDLDYERSMTQYKWTSKK